MIVYEVTAIVEPDLRQGYESFMRREHIPDLMATGIFTGATFEQSDPGRYRVRYVADTRDALNRYLSDHAPGLREDFFEHFPAGVRLEREVWNVEETFP